MGGVKKLSTKTHIMERVNPAAENQKLTVTPYFGTCHELCGSINILMTDKRRQN